MNTTDNQNEIFDIVNVRDQVIGKATRREVHANNKLIHRSVGVFVFNSKGELLLQQRSATKDTDPLKWTISCSGHVSAKLKAQSSKIKPKAQRVKIYREAAYREMLEELGVKLKIKPVYNYICYAPYETEMCMLFKVVSDGPFIFHPKEIRAGKFFSQKELIEALQSRRIELSFMGEYALKIISWI